LAFGLIGGLSPMAVTAISSASGASGEYGVAWWVLAWSLVSAAAYAATLWLFPACNRTAAMPLLGEQRRPSDPLVLGGLRGLSVSVTAASGCSAVRGGDGGGRACPAAAGRAAGARRSGPGGDNWAGPAVKE
jgi:hypothetical protein